MHLSVPLSWFHPVSHGAYVGGLTIPLLAATIATLLLAGYSLGMGAGLGMGLKEKLAAGKFAAGSLLGSIASKMSHAGDNIPGIGKPHMGMGFDT